MTRIRYDINIMKYISLFETLTNTKLKDCIVDDRILFVVQEGQIGKAIGKKGVNVKRIKDVLKKNIKLVEFNNDVLQFIQNMIYPLKIKNIQKDDGVITISGNDTKTKGILIGRESKNLIFLTSVVKRYFDLDKIRVV